jgi:hypothetical protein
MSLVLCRETNLPDSLQSLIKKKHEEKSLDTGADLDIKWRVLNWKLDSSVESRKLLSKAVAIFHVSIFLFLYCVDLIIVQLLYHL